MTSNFPRPRVVEMEVKGRTERIIEADTFLRILQQMHTDIYALAGRGNSGPVLGGPLNMGNVVKGTNSATPADDEFLTYAKAKAYFDPSVMQLALSMKGKYKLSIQGLPGRSADPQVPLVEEYNPNLSGYYQAGTLVSQGGSLQVVQQGSPGQVLVPVRAVGLVTYGTRAAMPAAAIAGSEYYATDMGWCYYSTGAAWAFEAGLAFLTEAERLAYVPDDADDRAAAVVIDTASLWQVESGAWVMKLGFPAANGAVVKHGRITTGSIPASSSAAVTVSWPTAFGGTNYSVSADVVDSATDLNALRVHHVESIAVGSVTVRVANDDGANPRTGILHVKATHD